MVSEPAPKRKWYDRDPAELKALQGDSAYETPAQKIIRQEARIKELEALVLAMQEDAEDYIQQIKTLKENHRSYLSQKQIADDLKDELFEVKLKLKRLEWAETLRNKQSHQE